MKIETDNKNINPNNFISQSFLAPLLSKRLIDCVDINENQVFYARGQNVDIDIDPNNPVTYPTNAPICISQACLSYNCLGLTLPVSFLYCGNLNTFEVSDSGCNCVVFVDTIPEVIQRLIENTITTANSANGVAENVFSATSVTAKTQNAIDAATLSSQAALNASEVIQALFNNSYPAPADNTVEKAVDFLTQGVLALAEAQTAAAENVNNQAGITSNADAIADNLTTALTQLGLAAGEIQTITSPTPPSSAITSANRALNQVTIAQNDITNFRNTPNWNTLSIAIDNVYLAGRYAEIAVYQTASASGTTPADRYADSLGTILFAIFTAQSSDDAIFQSLSSTGSTQIRSLDTSAYDSISSANFSKQAVDYPNSEVADVYNFYRNFTAQISTCECKNKSCCFESCANPDKHLFLQSFYAFHVCRLSISVCGTIGTIPFTGTISYPNVIALSDLNFQQINVSALISKEADLPCGLINITETLDPCLALQCIYPTGPFSPPSGIQSFPVDVYFNFGLIGSLNFTQNTPIPVFSSTDTINCNSSADFAVCNSCPASSSCADATSGSCS